MVNLSSFSSHNLAYVMLWPYLCQAAKSSVIRSSWSAAPIPLDHLLQFCFSCLTIKAKSKERKDGIYTNDTLFCPSSIYCTEDIFFLWCAVCLTCPESRHTVITMMEVKGMCALFKKLSFELVISDLFNLKSGGEKVKL